MLESISVVNKVRLIVPQLQDAKTEVIKTDILVLGGGLAGCFAAIKARECDADVVLIDKGNLGRSGFSCMISGLLRQFDPEKDDYERVFQEGIEAGEWINDQKWLETTIKESYLRVKELNEWGVKFQKEGAEYIRRPVIGSAAGHFVLLVKSGLQLMSILRGEVLRRGIRVVERVMSTDLLSSDEEVPPTGRITGAVGFNIRTGSYYIIKAKATIIATGATNSMNGYANQRNLSGDGKAMAFKAGCEFRNVDLTYWQPTPVGQTTSAGLGILVGEGTIIVNNRGERFMQKWSPHLLERAPRTVIGKAIAFEEREGRGPCYFDATHLSESAYGRIEKCIPLILKNFEARRINLRKDRIQYSNVIGDEIIGGIKINRNSATTISGLYAAGAATDSIGEGTGAGYGGVSAATYGCQAGKAAAKYIREIEDPIVNNWQVETLRNQIYAPLNRTSGLEYQQVRAHCKLILENGLLGPIKSEQRLREAIIAAQKIREEEIPRLIARDYHGLARVIGLGNELLFLELFPRCSLLRTESRGSHFHADYPDRDDINWLKWVVARREGDSIKVWTEPIPFKEFRYQPSHNK